MSQFYMQNTNIRDDIERVLWISHVIY